MRIALLTDGIWPFVIGGMQRHSYYLCRYLSRNGVHVELYHTTKNGIRPNIAELFSGDELAYIHERYIPYPASDKLPGHYLRTSYRYSEMVYKALLAESAADLIYAKGLAGWHLIKEKKRGKKLPPVCINVHGYEYYQRAPGLKSKLAQLMLRPAFRFINENADYIYSYGAPVTALIRMNIGSPAAKIIEIPAGIEADLLRISTLLNNDIRKFVFIGRFEARKGVPVLMRAVAAIDQKAEFQFHYVGSIPEKLKPVSPKWIFHGLVSDKLKLKQILEDCDVLVCPSFAEGMPNVILEGMAAGCAVIATKVGAVPLMVDEQNGWLTEPGDSKGLSAALEAALALRAEDLIKKKTASMRKVRENFLWDKIIEDLIRSFQRIIPQTQHEPA